MAKYKISGDGVRDNETGESIPNNEGNRHWIEYLKWISMGNVPDPEFTQEELDEQALRNEIIKLRGDLSQVLAWQFRMILEMHKVGVTKGLWAADDFSQGVKDKAIIFKQKSDRLIELGE